MKLTNFPYQSASNEDVWWMFRGIKRSFVFKILCSQTVCNCWYKKEILSWAGEEPSLISFTSKLWYCWILLSLETYRYKLLSYFIRLMCMHVYCKMYFCWPYSLDILEVHQGTILIIRISISLQWWCMTNYGAVRALFLFNCVHSETGLDNKLQVLNEMALDISILACGFLWFLFRCCKFESNPCKSWMNVNACFHNQ